MPDSTRSIKRHASETPEQRENRLAYHREWMRRFRLAHPEKAKQANAAWQQRNAGLVRDKSKARYLAKRKEIIAQVCDYSKRNREKINARNRARLAADPEKVRASQRASYLQGREKDKARRIARSQELAAYMRHKRASDPCFLVADRLRRRINCALSRQSAGKHAGLVEFAGCSLAELVSHIERQFSDGMSWENRFLWHIDHIIPCSAFDLTNPDQQMVAFHYTNLRPVWASDNLRKNAKIPGGQSQLFWDESHVIRAARRLAN